LESLLEGEELEDGEIHRGVKAHAALVGTDGGALLDAEAAVDLYLALVDHPGNAELDDALWFHQALKQSLFRVLRVALYDGPQAVHDFFHSLHEFGLMRIPAPDLF